MNSRYIALNSKKLKLTEKEANIILYLFNSDLPVNIEKLQQEVWGFNSNLETHTVETHVYRLRKKIFEVFSDRNFILSNKHGYQIN